MEPGVIAFATFGLASQALLVAFFAARRWALGSADVLGRLAYGFAGLGLPIGLWLAVGGQSYRLFVGPLLLAVWAIFGVAVDLWRPRPWRGPAVDWSVMAPYVTLYFFAQMFLWWPLWDLMRAAWAAFAVLFIVNTALNLRGHLPASRHP